jgi:hypothetical protein
MPMRSDYQPAGNTSLGGYAATRVVDLCFMNLPLALAAEVYSATFGMGALTIAYASRGGLIGASTASVVGGGTMVGKLVSKIIRSGHRCADLTRIIDRSNRASAKVAVAAAGQYRSAMKSIPKSMLPTNKKYRPMGI